jgi:putative secretion ATPase (PEP-CTERM system associated)
MYERFYNLRERPFALSPDPDYLYPSRVHKEALSYLRYGIEGHAGFVVITGDIGCGKTTLLQTVLRGIDRQTSVSRIVNSMLDARELLEAVMLDFGLDPGQGRSKPHLLHELSRFLVDQRMAGRLALLVIDEAQNLTMAALEEVRMLSNLETEKSKLIQIVLVGQPNLREILARPELEQLRQRVTVSYHLQRLDSDETAAYINHRLRRAAIGAPLEFSREVTDRIHLHSRGTPRKINVIADAILLFGYSEDQRTIDLALTAAALEELEATGVLASNAAVETPAPAPPPATAATEQQRQMAVREARIAEREQWVADQQRILQERYRQLRAQSPAPAAQASVAPAAAAAPAAPLAPAPVTRDVASVATAPPRVEAVSAPRLVIPPAPTQIRVSAPAQATAALPLARPAISSRGFCFHEAPAENMWARLRRQFMDALRPVLED